MKIFDEKPKAGSRGTASKGRRPRLADRHVRGSSLGSVHVVRGPAANSPVRDLKAALIARVPTASARSAPGTVAGRDDRDLELRVTDPAWRFGDSPRASLFGLSLRNAEPPDIEVLGDPLSIDDEITQRLDVDSSRSASEKDDDDAARSARSEKEREEAEKAAEEAESSPVSERERQADALAALVVRLASAIAPTAIKVTDASRLEASLRAVDTQGDDMGTGRPPLQQKRPGEAGRKAPSPVAVDVAPATDAAGREIKAGTTGDDGPLAKEDQAAAAKSDAVESSINKQPSIPALPAPKDDKEAADNQPLQLPSGQTAAIPAIKVPPLSAKDDKANKTDDKAPDKNIDKTDSKAKAKVPGGEDAASTDVVTAAAAPAGGGGGGEVAAWKGRVGGATANVKEKNVPDSDMYVTQITTLPLDPNAVRAAKLKTLEEEGKKAITPAKEPPENKEAIPADPTHSASKLVDERCGKKIELTPQQTTLPDLQETPHHHIPVIGSRLGVDKDGFEFVELPPVEGEKGAKPERIYKPGGIPPLDEKKKKQWDDLQKKLATTPASTKRALGKGVTVKEENAPPPVVVPDFAKVDVGDVLARLLAEPDEYAKQAYQQARKSFYTGVLDEVPNSVGTALEKAEAPAFAAELQRVADAAGVKKEDLDKKVADRRNALVEKQGKNAADLSKAHEQAKEDIKNSGKGYMDALASVRARIDDEGERRAAAAKGGVDLEEMRKKRDAMYTAIDDKVAKWVVIYDGNGKRFKQGLDKAKGEQMQAYQVAAKQDEWELKKDAGADQTKLIAAQKIYDETTKVWLQQRQKDIDKIIGPAKLAIGKKVEGYQDDLRSAGKTAAERIREWYDKSIGYERGWWSRFLDMIISWLSQAKKESAAWESARAAETSEALNKDMNFLAEARLRYGEEMDDAAIDSMKGLGEEQKAILKEYYKKGGKDAVQALAAGIATRIRLQRQPEIIKALEKEVTALSSPGDLPLLVAIGNKQTAGFKGKYFLLADEIHVAVRGWGTDEGAIFKALGGLTPIQAKCVEIDYEARYHENMRARLKDELDDWASTSHDWERAQDLLNGDKAGAAAVELNQAMEGTFLGTGWGTDEDAIFNVLRGKTPEEIEAIKKAYKQKYGKDLGDHLKDELGSGPGQTAHDVEEAGLLIEGKAEEAMAVEMDRTMRGTFLGTGWGTDRKGMEAVYDRIRKDVEAEGQRNGWSSAMIKEELARRNAGLDAAYEKRYGKEWTDRKPGESALRTAFRDEMQGEDLNLIVGMAEQDWKKVDAARIQLEHTSFWYADDKVIRDSMSAQYKRDIANGKIDGYLDVDRKIAVEKEIDAAHMRPEPPPLTKEERDKGVISETDFLDKWRADKTAARRKADRKVVDKDAEASAREKAPDNMKALAAEFDKSYSNFDPNTGMKMSFSDVVRMDTMGSDHDAVNSLLDKGYLTADEEVQYAVQGAGTDEDKLKETFKGKSKEEIIEIAEAWAKKHPPDPGDTRTPYERFKARIREELSGRDEFDIMDVVEYGDAQTPEEQADKAWRRYAFESRSSNWFASEQLDSLAKSAAMLDEDVDALRAFEANRPKPGDKDYTAEKLREWDDKWEEKNSAVEAQVENIDRAVENHRHSVDEITDTIVTIVTIVVLVVITAVVAFFTAGAGLAAVGAALASTEFLVGTALATAAATIATKAILKGDAYGWEEMGVDATVGIVDAMAAKFTAGMGSKLLKMGFLARMAEEGGMFARMAAHGLAEGAEGFVQGLPSALAGNLLNDANYKGGNALLNIVGGSVTQAGMSGLMAGGLGMLGGVGKPKHMISPKELAEFKLHPENQNRLFAAYKEKVPGATREQFLKHMDEAVLKGKPDIFFSDTVQRAMKAQLLEHMDDAARKAFKDMPIEVLSAAEFKKLTGSETGQAVTMFRKGKPSIIVKAGADLSVLGEEGIHLLQSSDKATKDLVKSLDEAALKNWKKLPPEKKVELYRNKLQVEIEAHERLLNSLEAKKGISIEPGSAANQIERTKKSLEQLRGRLTEVNALKPAELAEMAKAGKPQYLKDPPRLFNKEPGVTHAPGVDAHGPPSEVKGPAKEAPGAHPAEKPPAARVEEPALTPEAKAKAEADARIAESKATATAAEAKKVELEAKAKKAEVELQEKTELAKTAKDDVTKLKGDVDDLAIKKQLAKDELKTARDAKKLLEGELRGTTGEARKAKLKQIEAAKADVTAKTAAAKTASTSLEAAETKLAAAKGKARLAKTDLETAQRALNTANKEAKQAARDAEAALRRARLAAREPGDLEISPTRPDRADPKVKELEGKPLSKAEARETSFRNKLDEKAGDTVNQVGPAWKEGGDTYRIVEHVDGKTGRVVEVHEEIFGERGWVKRGSEAVRAGEHAERASKLMTDEALAGKLINASDMGAGGRAGKEYVRFEVQSNKGHGFDDILIHFEGEKATIKPFEVKQYVGVVSPEEFTAVGRKLKDNLAELEQKVLASNLSDAEKKAVRQALREWRVEIEVRLGPSAKVSDEGLAKLAKTAGTARDIDVADQAILKKAASGGTTADFDLAKAKYVEAREKFLKTGSSAAQEEVDKALAELSKHGIDLNPARVGKPKVNKPTTVESDFLKRTPEWVDPKQKNIDYLRQRIGEPSTAKPVTEGPKGGTGGEGGSGSSTAAPAPKTTTASDPVRIKAVADEAIAHAFAADRIRVKQPGQPTLGWGGFDITTSLAWSKRRFKPFEIAQMHDLRLRLTNIADLDPARFGALSLAEKKVAITRAVEATMESLGIPKSRRPIVQFQNLPAGSFGWMDWRFNPAGGRKLSPATKKGVIVISENLNVGDAVGTAVHEGRHYYQAYQAYMDSVGRTTTVHPFARDWRANLPGSGGVYYQHAPAYFTQPIERDAESFGRRVIDLLPARWPGP